jgi:hypothetical protein
LSRTKTKKLTGDSLGKNTFIACPLCGESLKLDLSDLRTEFKDDKEFCKVCYTHGIFGKKPHTLIIDIDRNLDPRQLTVADKTFTRIG